MNIKELVMEYNNIKEQCKIMDAKKKELANKIKEIAKEKGTQDAKGSSYYTTDDNWVLGNIKATTIRFNQDKAKAFLEEHHADLLERVTDTVEYINEDKVVKLVSEGLLTVEEVEQMSNISVSYKVDLRQQEVEEEPKELPKVTCKPRVKKLVRK